MTDTQQTPNTEEQQSAPNLTLQDLILVTQVIQLSATRGSIRAEEMEVVGGLYTKIIAFLEASGALTRPEAGQSAEPTVE